MFCNKESAWSLGKSEETSIISPLSLIVVLILKILSNVFNGFSISSAVKTKALSAC